MATEIHFQAMKMMLKWLENRFLNNDKLIESLHALKDENGTLTVEEWEVENLVAGNIRKPWSSPAR